MGEHERKRQQASSQELSEADRLLRRINGLNAKHAMRDKLERELAAIQRRSVTSPAKVVQLPKKVPRKEAESNPKIPVAPVAPVAVHVAPVAPAAPVEHEP